MWASMGQTRLFNLALLHIHYVTPINLEKLLTYMLVCILVGLNWTLCSPKSAFMLFNLSLTLLIVGKPHIYPTAVQNPPYI